MRKLAIAAGMLAIFCSGCAIVGGGQEKEDGSAPSWSILGADEKWAFNTADEKCPHGYYVDMEYPNRPLPPLYTMEIRCKPESSRNQDVVLRPIAQKPYNPSGVGEVGSHSFQIEQMPEVRACKKVQPQALIESKAPGVEVYKVDCTNGSSLRVRCEFNVCTITR